jgi:hypothetical protein
MPLLRRGITGFDAPSDVDFTRFKRAVYAAAQSTGASVIAATPTTGVTPNFHQTLIRFRDCELAVICNRTFPVVAFVEHPVDMAGVQPVEVPELVENFSNSGFEVASACELLRPIGPDDLQILTEAERNQAKYWKPQTVGQIVFNWWD